MPRVNFNLYDKLRSAILPLTEIDKALPERGKITELGCGRGVICKYLARKKGRKIIGVDLEKSRIGVSSKPNLKFRVGNAVSLNYTYQDAFVISDVLHHLKPSDQYQLLSKLSQSLKKNGKLLIKEIDKNENIRSKLSRFWDFVFYPKEKINYQESSNLKKFLTELGFSVSIKKTSRLFPGSTVLFICRKNG